MKKIILTAICLIAMAATYSQVPQQMNYQAIVRNSAGTPLADGTNVTIRFQIHDGSPQGPVVYQEQATVVTNQFGLVNYQIGSAGDLQTIAWGSAVKYLQVEIDPAGGTNFTDMGTSQLISVPYALFAANSANGPPGSTGATGAVGNNGNTGPTGAPGTPGVQGAGGATGAAGIQGATGPIGPQGAVGAQGPQGATGAQGFAGPAGVEGATGLQGPTGPAGATGTQGVTGAQGIQGATGPQGPVGASGPQGITGTTGIQGPAGSVGINGPTGANGVAGANGATGATGTTGAAGANGATGADGADGNTGAAGPQGNTGLAGDTGVMGPQGIQGITGSDGPQGPTGNTGAQGITGTTGADGIQGPTGLPGATGDTGLLAAGVSPGNTPYWNGSAWIDTTSNIYNNGGPVGIGTTPGSIPINTLDVYGNVAVGSDYAGDSLAPINGMIVEGPVGVGTTNPVNKLDVKGSAVIGYRYAGDSVAPHNGLAVEGSVGIGTSNPQNKLDVKGSEVIGFRYGGDSVGPADGLAVEGRVGIGITSPANMLDVRGGVAIGRRYVGDSLAPYNGLIVEGRVGIGTASPVSPNMLDVNGGVSIGTYAGQLAAPINGLVVSGWVAIGNNWANAQLEVDGNVIIDTTLKVYGGLRVGGVTDSVFGAAPGISANDDGHYGGGIEVSGPGGFFDYYDDWITFSGDNGLRIVGNSGPGTLGALDVEGQLIYNAWDTTQQPGYILATDGHGNASWQSAQSALGGSLWSEDSSGTGIYNTDFDNVGIGTGNPVNMLDVSGGMAIGADYAGVDSIGAPYNGMLIEGSVGVGTTHPFSKMEIVGNLTISPANPVDTGGIGNADIQLNSAWRPTIYPFGPNVPPDSMDIQLRSAGHGILWLNHDNSANIIMNWGNAGGNVGIGGLSAPIAKLDIQGTLRINDGTQQQGYVFVSDNNGIGSWQAPSTLSGGLWTTDSTGIHNASLGRVGIGVSKPVNILDVNGGMVVGNAYAGDSTAPYNGMLIQGTVGIGLTKPLPQDMLDVFGSVTIGDSAGVFAAPARGLAVSGNVKIGYVPEVHATLHVGGTMMVDSVFLPEGGIWARGVASTRFNASPSIHANADEHDGGGIAISDYGAFIKYGSQSGTTFAGLGPLNVNGFYGPGNRGSFQVHGDMTVNGGDTITDNTGTLTVNGTFTYNAWDTTQKAGYVLTTNGSGKASWAANPGTVWSSGTDGIYSLSNVGIGTAIPASALEVSDGDVYISKSVNGVIMTSPDGSCYRLTVANGGTAVFTAIACP